MYVHQPILRASWQNFKILLDDPQALAGSKYHTTVHSRYNEVPGTTKQVTLL